MVGAHKLIAGPLSNAVFTNHDLEKKIRESLTFHNLAMMCCMSDYGL